MTIKSARITECLKFTDPLPTVFVTTEDGEEHKLFDYMPDELHFSPTDLEGLTIQEAHDLKARKDVAYLRS